MFNIIFLKWYFVDKIQILENFSGKNKIDIWNVINLGNDTCKKMNILKRLENLSALLQ